MPSSTSNPRLRPVIRVFVSSTFSDLKQERNALQAQVFPKLEQLCAQNGFQFQAIDLRWGVSSEAGLDHRTMRICFDELRRAQDISPEPNFLVLLGNRYGWRPLPEEISKAEFEQLAAAADSDGENQAPIPGTHGKTARQVLCDWYRCDENVLLPEPPETDPDNAPLNYLLQPRTQNLCDGRDYTRTKDDPPKDTQDWIDVQKVLWRIINATFPAAALDRRFEVDWAKHIADVNDRQHPKRAIPQIARFQASATEQEIWCGTLSAANAERHVIACFREIANRDDFVPADMKDFFDLTETGKFDDASAARQEALKKALRQRLYDNAPVPIPFSRLKREQGKMVVDASKESIKEFCQEVKNRLWSIIERQIAEYWKKSGPAPMERGARELEIEQEEHARFGHERGGADSFVGRKDELPAISKYLESDSPWPLVVHGASGCGKTALLARAAEELQRSEVGGQKPEVVVRFIGTTPQSSDIRSLLRSLCQQLRCLHQREGELPSDIKALSEELRQHFQSTTPDQPLILFLDALDQLSDADNGRLLNWVLTGQLPPHVKLVASCLSDRAKDDPATQPFAELTRRQLPTENFINLDALSEDEARTLLFDRWLHQRGRTVSQDQREHIGQRLKCVECRQPIYLKLLFEESRLWRSYDAAPELGESVPAILDQFFKRLQLPTNHHPLLVERAVGYLAASRHGLAENEILEVLFADPDYKAALEQATEQTRHELPAGATRIPIVSWSRLRFDLAPYLAEQAAPGASVLTFYHRQVAEYAAEHFLATPDVDRRRHEHLAKYFHRQLVDPQISTEEKNAGDSRPVKSLPPIIRIADELPWQLAKVGSKKALVTLLAILENIAFFYCVWKPNPDDAKRYWAMLKREIRADPAKSYADVIQHPGEVHPTLLWILAIFLGETAYLDASLKLRLHLVEYYRRQNNWEDLQAALGNISAILHDLGRLVEALELQRQQEQICLDHNYLPGLCKALSGQANILFKLGRRRRSRELLLRAIEIYRQISDPLGEAHALHLLATLLKEDGDYQGAIQLHLQQAGLAALGADESAQARALTGISACYFHLESYAEAIRYSEGARRIALIIGDDDLLQLAISGIANSKYKLNDLTASEALFLEVLRICTEANLRLEITFPLTYLAAICRETGRASQALQYARQAEHISRQNKDACEIAEALALKGSIQFLLRGEFVQGFAAQIEAFGIAREGECAHTLRKFRGHWPRPLRATFLAIWKLMKLCRWFNSLGDRLAGKQTHEK